MIPITPRLAFATHYSRGRLRGGAAGFDDDVAKGEAPATGTYDGAPMKRMLAAAVCGLLTACGNGSASSFADGGFGTQSRRDSVNAAHDGLLAESMAVMEFVGELNNELARAGRLRIELSPGVAAESKLAEAKHERQALTTRIRDIIAQLDAAERDLERAQERVRQLTGRESALSARIASLTLRLDSLRRSAIAEQRALAARITDLERSLAALAEDTTRLSARLARLSDSVNTVYYVAATEEELLERGVIVREGGRRYIFAGPRPLHPARQLPPAAFTSLDMAKSRTISLPPGHYRIVSRHSIDLVEPEVLADGAVAGVLRVRSPETFWAGSKYLILVRTSS